MLILKDVSMYYHSGETVVAGLNKINIELERGEFVAITGESGSGKTTLLNVISALLPYHDGEMYVDGKQTSYFDDADWEEYRRRKIGFVFQDYSLIDSYTAVENVAAAMMINGTDEKTARLRAVSLLERVGLSGFETHRAGRLSSGQKQRLSIARALAKDTEIIVADEPTGNLDTENGRQIVELLRSLSRDRLVIMVTHNTAEADPYITRKIRLHDGRVVADVLCNPRVSDTPEELPPHSGTPDRETSRRFARLNVRAQPRKTLLVTGFMLVSLMAMFVFLGSFLSEYDDSDTKIYDPTAFANGDDTRICVRNYDGSPLTSEQLKEIGDIEHVANVDKYDLVNDVTYYWREGTDYKFIYNTAYIPESDKDTVSVSLISGNFMRSCTSVTEDMLTAGRMPERADEVIAASDDTSIIGQTFRFYFKQNSGWGAGQHVALDLTVCGTVPGGGGRVYFSDQLSFSIAESLGDKNGVALFNYLTSKDVLMVNGFECYLIVDGTLDAASYRLSSAYSDLNITEGGEIYTVGSGAERRLISRVGMADYSGSTKLIVAVSPKVYELAFGNPESGQASVYIESYAYCDSVLAALSALGLDTTVPYRSGTLEYDPGKVQERLVNLCISIGGFIGVIALEIIVLGAFLKLKRKDYSVLTSVGMTVKMVRDMNRYELYGEFVAAALLFAAAVAATALGGVKYITDMLKYFRWYHFMFLAICASAAAAALTERYNRYLTKRLKLRVIRDPEQEE